MTGTNPQALIERALAEPADSDFRWSYVMTLHRLGSEETFRAAVELCRSDEPARRALGADILAQLRPYRTAAVEVLLQALLALHDYLCRTRVEAVRSLERSAGG